MYLRNMDSTHPLWKRRSHLFAAGPAAGSVRLSHMINEFERALRGTVPADALALQTKIRSARTKLDLWDLRADVHVLVRQAFDQWEARVRLEDLNSLFDPPTPRGMRSLPT